MMVLGLLVVRASSRLVGAAVVEGPTRGRCQSGHGQ